MAAAVVTLATAAIYYVTRGSSSPSVKEPAAPATPAAQTAPIENPDQFFNIPDGAPTVCDLMPKNENNQFELEISAIQRLSPDTLKVSLKFPNPDWLMGLPNAKHMKIFKPAEGD